MIRFLSDVLRASTPRRSCCASLESGLAAQELRADPQVVMEAMKQNAEAEQRCGAGSTFTNSHGGPHGELDTKHKMDSSRSTVQGIDSQHPDSSTSWEQFGVEGSDPRDPA